MATRNPSIPYLSTSRSANPLRSFLFGNRFHPGFLRKAFHYGMLFILAVAFLVPLYWMLNTALKTPDQLFSIPPRWLPNPAKWSNFWEAMNQKVGSQTVGVTEGTIPVSLFVFNTALITINGVVATVISSSLVAYAFARMKFPGRDQLFFLILSTLMIPFAVVMVPQFIIWKNLDWLDKFLPLMVPHWFGSAWNIFLLRQFFMSIPLEYDESAMIDGASRWDIFWRILLPLSKPALGAVGVFAFVYFWNDFLGPLIILSSPTKFTLTLYLVNFSASFWKVTPWNLYMAAALVIILPCLLLFFFSQNLFLQGIALTDFKR